MSTLGNILRQFPDDFARHFIDPISGELVRNPDPRSLAWMDAPPSPRMLSAENPQLDEVLEVEGDVVHDWAPLGEPRSGVDPDSLPILMGGFGRPPVPPGATPMRKVSAWYPKMLDEHQAPWLNPKLQPDWNPDDWYPHPTIKGAILRKPPLPPPAPLEALPPLDLSPQNPNINLGPASDVQISTLGPEVDLPPYGPKTWVDLDRRSDFTEVIPGSVRPRIANADTRDIARTPYQGASATDDSATREITSWKRDLARRMPAATEPFVSGGSPTMAMRGPETLEIPPDPRALLAGNETLSALRGPEAWAQPNSVFRDAPNTIQTGLSWAERQLIGKPVVYEVNGNQAFDGILEYIRDGWAGIRGADGRIDEVPSHMIRPA